MSDKETLTLNENEELKRFSLRLTEDKIEAYITLFSPGDNRETDDSIKSDNLEKELLSFLEQNKITYGIDREAIGILIKTATYQEILISQGQPIIEGKDGYFEYHFDTNPEKKPIILEDGSVDYNTLGKIVLCKEDDLLVTYHPAKAGVDGINVFGMPVKARPVKELAALRGKGFNISESGLIYTAAYDGKVEFSNQKLQVSKVYIVNSDVDAVTGNVFFNGDIIVNGNVYSNVTIEAAGSITVFGHVETAVLKAGKDIILQNGMQGSGKGYINAKGEVSAKFFEQTTVIAGGRINANAVLNCILDSNSEIIVSGKRGIIVGGITTAVERVVATILGNKSEVVTQIFLGVNLDFNAELAKMDEIISTNQDEIAQIEKDYRTILLEVQLNSTDALQQQKTELMRKKIRCEAEIREQTTKKANLFERRERSSEASILVNGTIYIGTKVTINCAYLDFYSECKNVTLKKERAEIHIYSNI